MDTTRMPHAMHSFYLREMYLHNNLIKRDHLKLDFHLPAHDGKAISISLKPSTGAVS